MNCEYCDSTSTRIHGCHQDKTYKKYVLFEIICDSCNKIDAILEESGEIIRFIFRPEQRAQILKLVNSSSKTPE